MFEFKFADIGEGIHEGQILKWLVKVGDAVKEGKPLVVVETDKVNADLPSPVSGVVHKLGAEVGQTIHVGDTLVWIDESGTAPTEENQPPKAPAVVQEKSAGVVGSIEVSDEVIKASDEMASPTASAKISEKVLASPVARKLAADLGVDIKTVTGSGESGRVMKDDILKAAGTNNQAPVASSQAIAMPTFPDSDVTRVKISKLRKTIVNAMSVAAAVIPMTTLMDEYDVHRLVEVRERQKEAAKTQGVKLTYLAFFAKAVTLALRDYPLLNSSFDHEKDEIIFKKHINLGIAVDTNDGLIVPNIKDADTKSIMDLAQEIERVATEARERTIKLDTLQNGTFTLTNYGAFGMKYGTPVIKHPEVAILGIGGIYKKPIVDEAGNVVVREMLPLSLTVDHRIVDGADGGRFLLKLKEYLSDPASLLLRLK
ncbi:MAG: dihydrolipoamide acetyltransferase family protein [Bacilli bacterium]|jgi:pyruvate dehydrogenase E2 component (dihydrolipoamide acetyltransferase)